MTQPTPAESELPDKPGLWKRRADSRDAYELVVRRNADEDGNVIPGPLLCSGWCGPVAILCSTANLPRGHWTTAAPAELPCPPPASTHSYERRGNCGCESCLRCKVAAKEYEVAELQTKYAKLRDAYEDVMDAVRRSLMEHGDCKSGKRYNGLPKACTACMAKIELTELAAQWKGRTVRLA